MSTEAITLFVVAALFMAVLLILSGMSTRRAERRDLETARAREEAARREAEEARLHRATWEARLAAEAEAQQGDAIVAFRDPRGLADGLGRSEPVGAPGHRFSRDVPAPFAS